MNNTLTDIPGLRVGHAAVPGPNALSGTTVVLAPPGGAVAAVEVRGGGPGTRETDALDPNNVVERIDAVVLTGGSAYGLDAASGVMAWLEEQGRGVRVGPEPHQVVPVVPAACVFDLGRGGDWRARPDAAVGRAAVEAAATEFAEGNAGAGTGAVVGGVKGGVGTASVRLASGVVVAALVVVNAVGSAIDPGNGVLYGEYGEIEEYAENAESGESKSGTGPMQLPPRATHLAAQERIRRARERMGLPPLNTTLAVVATDARLTGSQAQKLAGTAHDGLARAIRPAHLMHDGDTIFALATGSHTPAPPTTPSSTPSTTPSRAPSTTPSTDASPSPSPSPNPSPSPTPAPAPMPPEELNLILAAGADVVARAIVRGVRAAESVEGAGGTFPSYRDLYGS
ncbi:P1 family peptidase [Streptomyces sp. ASQP_92]|nr:P1 family peptidase [Streptomyces sp. ASQP_92]MCT9092004.1 P1 family peptidase [Streptomyces sp. ASQP_92]